MSISSPGEQFALIDKYVCQGKSSSTLIITFRRIFRYHAVNNRWTSNHNSLLTEHIED